MRYSFILFGALFGFLLSRAGATTYDFYANLFLFKDLQLMGVMATAAAVGFAGITPADDPSSLQFYLNLWAPADAALGQPSFGSANATYLTEALDKKSSVMVSNVWGHYHSRIVNEFELISHCASQHGEIDGAE